jgi:flavin-dependent dehydrogenase
MTTMRLDGLTARTPYRTIDKPRLLSDLSRDAAVVPRALGPDEADGYDLVVDATGVVRALLPPCSSDLVLPTLQHRVIAEPLGDERLAAGVWADDVSGLGYVWVFPLGGDEYHVGVGGIGHASLKELLDRFYRREAERFAFTRICACRGDVRLASPRYSLPFHAGHPCADGSRRLVVGAGEAIGTVSPFTAEGIIFSLDCAALLAARLSNPEGYTRAVLAEFGWMARERETLDRLLDRRGRGVPGLRDRWWFYLNARRSGVEIPLSRAFRRMGSLPRRTSDERP